MKRLIALILLAPALAGGQQIYNVTEITPPTGSNYIDGFALNASGQITGELDNHAQAFVSGGAVPENLAFITAPNGGAISPLPAPVGVLDATGFGINNAGRVVGAVTIGDSGFGFITAPNGGAMTLLAGPANGINAGGQVVGRKLLSNGAFEGYISAPNGGALTILGTLPGTNTSEGLAVNNRGQVAGVSEQLVPCGGLCIPGGSEHAFFYSNGVMTDLGTLPGDPFSIGLAINSHGQVAGYASTLIGGGGISNAFVSAPNGGRLTDIGVGHAYGINDAGQVVGTTGDNGFIYERGSLFNLNTLIDPTLTRYLDIGIAYAINDSGDILAVGVDNRLPNTNGQVTFLLTPRNAAVPEPSTLALLSLGLAGVGLAMWRKAAIRSNGSESALIQS